MIGIFETDNGTKKRTQNDLNNFMKKLTEDGKSNLEDVWQKIYEDAVANCPVDTMSLVGTIKMVTGDQVGTGFKGSQITKDQVLSSGGTQTIFNGTIIVGDDAVINPKNGIPTSWYAVWVHDGHFGPNSKWIDGRPFLQEAFDKYANELNAAIANAGGP